MARIRKYTERGYEFKSLQFLPSNGSLDVTDFENIWNVMEQGEAQTTRMSITRCDP